MRSGCSAAADRSRSGFSYSAHMALAALMAEPPPMPTMTSGSNSSSLGRALRMWAKEGGAPVEKNSAVRMPRFRSQPSMSRTAPERYSTGSDTRKARFR